MLKRFDSARPRSVVAWAVLAGVVAGLLAASYHSIVSEPLVDDAIAIEDAHLAAMAAEGHHDAAPEQVSRSDQRGAGLFVGYGLLGAAYALVLSVIALSLRGPWLRDPLRRMLVAASILAGAITVLPWLKYPPNPPAVGDPATADERQRLYWTLVVLGGLVLAGAAYLSRRLRERGWPEARRIATVVAAVGLVLGVALAVLPPSPDAISAEVPASLIWRFRLASLGGNMLLWAVLAVGFGWFWAEADARRLAAATATAGAPSSAQSPAPTPDGAATGPAARPQNSMPFRAEIPSS